MAHAASRQAHRLAARSAQAAGRPTASKQAGSKVGAGSRRPQQAGRQQGRRRQPAGRPTASRQQGRRRQPAGRPTASRQAARSAQAAGRPTASRQAARSAQAASRQARSKQAGSKVGAGSQPAGSRASCNKVLFGFSRWSPIHFDQTKSILGDTCAHLLKMKRQVASSRISLQWERNRSEELACARLRYLEAHFRKALGFCV